MIAGNGEVAERLMAPVLKTGIPERVSGVRIPPSPPASGEGFRSRLNSAEHANAPCADLALKFMDGIECHKFLVLKTPIMVAGAGALEVRLPAP